MRGEPAINEWKEEFPGVPEAWFAGCAAEVLRAAKTPYASPGRHYHAWRHILECTEKLRGFPMEDPRAVFMAILFHDGIYVAGARDNEERSAELAGSALQRHSNMPASERAEVQRMILATKHHRVPESEASSDVRTVVDVDMSILGAAPDRYDEYAVQVRNRGSR